MTNNPHNLARLFASQLEADPIAASLVKEYCPPEKLIRLLDLGGHIGRILAEEASSPSEAPHNAIDVSTHEHQEYLKAVKEEQDEIADHT